MPEPANIHSSLDVRATVSFGCFITKNRHEVKSLALIYELLNLMDIFQIE